MDSFSMPKTPGSASSHKIRPVFDRKSSFAKTPSKTPNKGDRFIPTRTGSALDMELSQYSLLKENANPIGNANPLSPTKEEYSEKLAEGLFEGKPQGHKILAFKNKAPAPREGWQNSQRVLYTANKTSQVKKSSRFISQNPEKILDAPNLLDDYYLNLIDWSSQNVLSIALGNKVYLWNASSGEISDLLETEESNPITSVKWAQGGSNISIGLNDGTVQLWDVATKRALRVMRGHQSRVGVMAWNNYVLSTGSRDANIHNHDVRIRDHLVAKLSHHTQEVCGLAWNDDGSQLASGANDNIVNVWNNPSSGNITSPTFTFTDHQAAVKAIAFCPWQKDLLATGGGSADRHIRFWNTSTGTSVNSIDTGSQVSSLVWSQNPNCKEIVSGHGFSQNQLNVWKYPSLVKVAELKGHSSRILSMALSPDTKTVVSAAADETLRFWKIFDVETPSLATSTSSSSVLAKETGSKGLLSQSAITRSLNIR